MPISQLEIYGPMTTTERDDWMTNINPTSTRIILNSVTGQLEYWDAPFWKGVLGDSIYLPGTLVVDDAVSFSYTLTVSGDVYAQLGLDVMGNTTLRGTLGVTGNATVGGTLGVSGATALTTLTATGAVQVNSTLGATGNVTIGGTLGVTGVATIGGNLSVNGGSIFLVADTTFINSIGGGVIKFPADYLCRILLPTLIGADADPAAGVTLEIRGKELVTTEIEIDGAFNHDGANVGFYGTAPATIQTATGSRGGNAALASLLTALAATGIIIDSTT